ncbi:LOW QUALITY PROTEIN: hypothetical protein V2J09_003090 [Rumex salicifolius]
MTSSLSSFLNTKTHHHLPSSSKPPNQISTSIFTAKRRRPSVPLVTSMAAKSPVMAPPVSPPTALSLLLPPPPQAVDEEETAAVGGGRGGGKLAAWKSVRQERWDGELEVQGQIPPWLHGIYLRNGPGKWNIKDYHFRHLFDGYATLVKLHFNGSTGQVLAAHRQIESDAYMAASRDQKVCYREFSESPKPEGLLGHIMGLAGLLSGTSLTDNANTGVVKLGDGRVVCLTETQKGSIVVDPNTLDTVGRLEYTDSLGGLILHSAHPIVTDSEFLTLIPDLIRPGYVVAKMLAGTNERRVVGRVDCRGGPGPGWVHSFPVTENFIVVPEMPLRYCAKNLLRAEPTPLYKFAWHPESKAFLHVMCRKSGKVVASVEVPLYVTFHFINAYEETDKDGRGGAFHNTYGRPYGELEAALDPDEHGRGMDMCSINPAYLGKKYRYAYACGARRPCNFPNTITKVDLVKKTAVSWHEEGVVPSEPFFVGRPGATEEDDGIVISLVSDQDGEGYAVILDASTFEEIARAKFPYGLPYGLHGCWIPL